MDLERPGLAPRYFRPPNQSSPPREVIDLTRDPPSVKGDNDDGGDVTTKVSWFRKTRMTRCRVRLIPPSLIGRFQVVDQLPPAPTILPSEVTPTHRRRLYHFIDGGPTWSREEIPLEECPTVEPKIPHTRTAFHRPS
jgi:hypothetical protein